MANTTADISTSPAYVDVPYSELSKDVGKIVLDIKRFQKVTGVAIYEIGKRLKYVRENNMIHGEWGQWCELIGFDRASAHKFITIYEELGVSVVETFQHSGMTALYLIATMPEESRHLALNPSGSTKSVRELKVIKRDLTAPIESQVPNESEVIEAEFSEVDPEPVAVLTLAGLNERDINSLMVTLDSRTEELAEAKARISELEAQLAEVAAARKEKRPIVAPLTPEQTEFIEALEVLTAEGDPVNTMQIAELSGISLKSVQNYRIEYPHVKEAYEALGIRCELIGRSYLYQKD